MKNIFRLIILTGLLMPMFAGCSDQLDDISPRHAIPDDKLQDSDLPKVLNGVYAKMESYAFSGWFNDDIQGENFATGPAATPMLDPCNMSPSNVNSNINTLSYWRNAFSALNQVNKLMALGYAAVDSESQSVKEIKASCHYFRAFIYYRLVTHFGNVPILRECSDEIIPISPESEVWKFFEEDIANALSLCPTQSSKWYVSIDAINALAARGALFQGKNTEAASYAQRVLSNSTYALVSTAKDFSSIFLPNSSSSEIIFGYVNNTRTSGYLNYYNTVNDVDGNWDYAPVRDLYDNMYNDDNSVKRIGDIRKTATFQSNPLNANRVIKFSNGKQQLAKNDDINHTPIIISRISEMYLIAAEGLGKDNGGADILHEFLVKRYKTVLSVNDIRALSSTQWQDLLLNERRKEFYAEGMRWQDIKRTRRYDQLATLNGRTYLMYYPIPQAEIDIAGTEAYPQNPGYND